MLIVRTRILLDGGPSQETWAALLLDAATMDRPRPTRDIPMSPLDVLAHSASLILGSVQHLNTSYIYILFFTTPPPFSSRI